MTRENPATVLGLSGFPLNIPISAAPRSIPKPDKPARGCRCNCRADADANMPGNVKPDLPLFVIESVTAADCVIAKKEGKRRAIRRPGMKPKHIDCRCVD